jgi:integrase/recombinase XerD
VRDFDAARESRHPSHPGDAGPQLSFFDSDLHESGDQRFKEGACKMPSEGTGADRKEVSLRQLQEKFVLQQQAAGRASHTLYGYRRVLSDFRNFLIAAGGQDDVRLIGRQQIHDYCDHVQSDFTFQAHQKAIWLHRLRIFFRWVSSFGITLSDPGRWLQIPAIKKKKFPPYLSQKEIAKLLDSISTETEAGLRDRAILELMYSSGLRSAEACRLEAADINFADRTIRILNAKGKKDRLVPVGKIALHYLDLYLQQRGLNLPGPLFRNLTRGGPLGIQGLREIVRRCAARAHLKKKCHPRLFRHSFAIHLLENGASIRHIQEMMGHARLHTTQKYTRILPAELKRVHAKTHPAERRPNRILPKTNPE